MQQRVRGIIIGLIVIFILGILMHDFNLAPDDWNGSRPLFGIILIGLHALAALGLLISSTIILVFSIKSQDETRKKLGMYGFVSIMLAFLGGIMTVGLKELGNSIGLFLMTLGFLAAFISYGRFFYLQKK